MESWFVDLFHLLLNYGQYRPIRPYPRSRDVAFALHLLDPRQASLGASQIGFQNGHPGSRTHDGLVPNDPEDGPHDRHGDHQPTQTESEARETHGLIR
jgi:hypothetical protein